MTSHSAAIHNATQGTKILTGSSWVTLPVPSASVYYVHTVIFFSCRDLLPILFHTFPFVFKPVDQKYFLAKQDPFMFPCSSARWWVFRPAMGPVASSDKSSWHCPSISLSGSYLEASKLSGFGLAVDRTVSFLWSSVPFLYKKKTRIGTAGPQSFL